MSTSSRGLQLAGSQVPDGRQGTRGRCTHRAPRSFPRMLQNKDFRLRQTDARACSLSLCLFFFFFFWKEKSLWKIRESTKERASCPPLSREKPHGGVAIQGLADKRNPPRAGPRRTVWVRMESSLLEALRRLVFLTVPARCRQQNDRRAVSSIRWNENLKHPSSSV